MAKYKNFSVTLKRFKATYKPYGHGINIDLARVAYFVCQSPITLIFLLRSHLHQKAPIKDSQTIALQFGASETSQQ